MKQPLRTLVLGATVLLAAGCASSVAGTAEVNPAVAAAASGAPSSTGPAASAPQSLPVQSDPAQSSSPVSGAPVSSAPESSVPQSSAPDSGPAQSPPATSAPESSAPSTSDASTSSTPPTTTAPTSSKSVSRPTKLSCPAGALVPSARTFCYQIPSGFVDGSTTATYPGTDPVKSAIQIKGTGRTRDLIFVTSTMLDVNADKLDDAVIKASLTKAFDANTSAVSTTAVKESTVAGDRAFETTIKFDDGVQQRYLIIFAGFTRVSVSCQWQDHAATINAACASVLGSLQIKNP